MKQSAPGRYIHAPTYYAALGPSCALHWIALDRPQQDTAKSARDCFITKSTTTAAVLQHLPDPLR